MALQYTIYFLLIPNNSALVKFKRQSRDTVTHKQCESSRTPDINSPHITNRSDDSTANPNDIFELK